MVHQSLLLIFDLVAHLLKITFPYTIDAIQSFYQILVFINSAF